MSLLTTSSFYKNLSDNKKPSARAIFSRLIRSGETEAEALEAIETRFKTPKHAAKQGFGRVQFQIITWILILVVTGYLIFASSVAYGSGPEGWFLAGLVEVAIVYLSYIKLTGLWNMIPKIILLAFVYVSFDALSQGVISRNEEISRLKQNKELLLNSFETVGNKWTKSEIANRIISFNEKIQNAVEAVSKHVSISESVLVKVRCLFLSLNIFLAHLVFHWRSDEI